MIEVLSNKERNGYIYKITCKVNNKIYIGETGRFVTLRWNDYVAACERGYFTEKSPNNEQGSLLFDMINIGIENFIFEVLEVIPNSTKKERLKREEYYIGFYKSKKTENGYNEISTFKENSIAHKADFVRGGEKTRFKVGGIPHNANKVFATSLTSGEIISFVSYNEATRFITENVLKDKSKFHTANRLIKIASKQHQDYCNYKWETTLDTNYDVIECNLNSTRQYQSAVCLIGEIFTNKKGLQFKIIDTLKENKRKIKFLQSGYEMVAATKEILNGSVKDWYSPSVCGIGIVGLEISHPQKHPLYDKWRGILRRCSNTPSISICEEWKLFSNFVNDLNNVLNDKNILDSSQISISLPNGECVYSPKTVYIKQIGGFIYEQ